MASGGDHPLRFARLHIEAVGGVAGDMLLGALLDLGVSPASLVSYFHRVPHPALQLQVQRVDVLGISALAVQAVPSDDRHAHRHLNEVMATLDALRMPPAAERRARDIFEILARAEAAVHGAAGAEVVHLHEVGALDSILDVAGIALALDWLGNPRVTAHALPSGHGTVETSHGVLAVPVPAVVEIADVFGIPLESASVEGETITPTGIAVVAQACSCFGSGPDVVPDRIGVGAGSRRFADRPNVVRIRAWHEEPA